MERKYTSEDALRICNELDEYSKQDLGIEHKGSQARAALAAKLTRALVEASPNAVEDEAGQKMIKDLDMLAENVKFIQSTMSLLKAVGLKDEFDKYCKEQDKKKTEVSLYDPHYPGENALETLKRNGIALAVFSRHIYAERDRYGYVLKIVPQKERLTDEEFDLVSHLFRDGTRNEL